MPLPVIDTRPMFRPLSAEIGKLFCGLTPGDWERPTIAGAWRVRDVAAHLVDTALRRLSGQRDRWIPGAGATAPTGRDLVALINRLNAEWAHVAERFSPRVLADLYILASTALADFVETLPLHDAAFFSVSWAGETGSPQWLDIGREFTEIWHHGSQIRDAVGAGPFDEPRWLEAVLQIALHVLPYTYRDVPGGPDGSLAVRITGPAAGEWTLSNSDGQRWDVSEGATAAASAIVTMTGEVAWRLFFNALDANEARSAVTIEGDARLALPLLGARSVIV
jgi:uncharacterized protein (TIGR03083 family)